MNLQSAYELELHGRKTARPFSEFRSVVRSKNRDQQLEAVVDSQTHHGLVRQAISGKTSSPHYYAV
jgi:hypothetical protein